MVGSWRAHYFFNKKGLPFKLLALYMHVFGDPDLHAHIRARSFRKYYQPFDNNVEIGAGAAIMSVEYYLKTKKPIAAMPYTNELFEKCMTSLKLAGYADNVTVGMEDARTLASLKDAHFDQVFLFDVLEHVEGDDLNVLQNINRILKKGGTVLISVPTPMYPLYFGEKFDSWAWDYHKAEKAKHHLRHYSLAILKDLLGKSNFELVSWQYHTNPFASKLCKIWYDYCYDFILLRYMLLPFLSLLSLFDLISPIKEKELPLKSSGLLIQARKR